VRGERRAAERSSGRAVGRVVRAERVPGTRHVRMREGNARLFGCYMDMGHGSAGMGGARVAPVANRCRELSSVEGVEGWRAEAES
jgi:hypothetical protein